VLLTNGEKVAFAWRLRYDAGKTFDERAGKAFAAVTKALDKALGPPGAVEGALACHPRRDRGPMTVALRGADLVFLLGPAKVTASGWSSAGDCAHARKWMREASK
jgi:hypothetical protein